MQNQLIVKGKGTDQYSTKQMAINFGKQFYEDYSQIEETVLEIKSNHSSKDITAFRDNQVSWVLRITEQLVSDKFYLEAENKISNVIGDKPYSDDYRLYHRLANIQTAINQTNKAEDNYRKALSIVDSDKNVWYDWIDMEHKRSRTPFAIIQAKEALNKTNNEITIVLQLLGMYKYQQKLEEFRKLADNSTNFYHSINDNDSLIKLLRYWKQIELSLLKDNKDVSNYFKVADMLIKLEDKETTLTIRREQLKIAKKSYGVNSAKYMAVW